MGCPGITGLENLALIFRIFETSLSATVCVISRIAIPSVHKPWSIGVLNPPSCANDGSMCKGLRSPLNLYKAACKYQLSWVMTTADYHDIYPDKISFKL